MVGIVRFGIVRFGIVKPAAVRAAPWIVLGLGLVIATAPAWRFLVIGFDPTLDQLLEIICRAPS
jgi:hypothetical protein